MTKDELAAATDRLEVWRGDVVLIAFCAALDLSVVVSNVWLWLDSVLP